MGLSFVPSSWSWERDAAGFYETYHNFFVISAVLYYPVIFGLRAMFDSREPLFLDRRSSVNWIFWWEVGLTLFSIIGAYHVVPLMLEPMWAGKTFVETVCQPGVHDDPRAYWCFLFMLSKVAEFGDTLFVVLRKKPLILLQHYHHIVTMLYCWYGTRYVYALNNTNIFGSGMNLCVHSVMYSWYAATRTGWKSPKALMMFVTLLQIVQMVFGCLIVYTSVYGESPDCGKWLAQEPMGFKGAGFMYFSYLVLFAKLFFENYIASKPKKRATADKPKDL